MMREPGKRQTPLLAAFLGLTSIMAAGCASGTAATTTTTHPVQSRPTESTVTTATRPVQSRPTESTVTVSAPNASPSMAARTYCHDVLTATPDPQDTLPQSARTEVLQAGENSGDPKLDAAAAALLKVWNEPNSAAFLHALEKVNTVCTRLGIAPPSGLAPTSG